MILSSRLWCVTAGLTLSLAVNLVHGQTAALKTLSDFVSESPNTEANAKSSDKDESNSSPRERGRILQKRNPVASEYQVFGELGSSPGADVDSEGVDYRAFFPTQDLFGTSTNSLSASASVNFNQLSGIAKGGGELNFRQFLESDEPWVISGQARSTSSDRRIEHYESAWLRETDSNVFGEEGVFFLDRPRYSLDLIHTRNNTFGLQIGHKIAEDLMVFYKGTYQDYFDNFHRNRLELQIGTGDFVDTQPFDILEGNLVQGSFTGARTRRYFGDTTNQRERQHHTLGAQWDTTEWTVDASLYQHNWDLAGRWYNWNYRDFGLDFTYEVYDYNLPTFTVDSGENILDQSGAQFTDLRVHRSGTQDTDLAWRLDAERKTPLDRLNLWLKSGILHRNKERESGENRAVYGPNISDLFYLSEVELTSPTGNIIGDQFEQPNGLDTAKGASLLETDSDKFVLSDYRSTIESAPTSYDAFEEVLAAYLLGTTRLRNWTVEAGLRYEATTTNSRGTVVIPESVNDPNEGVPIEEVTVPGTDNLMIIKELYAANDYSNWLPSAEATYRFSENSNLKASWYQLLMRPQYFDVVNYRRISVTTRSIREGNPNLLPTNLDKYRLAYSIATEALGQFSAEVYAIDIENFFYGAVSNEQILENGQSVEYSVGREENGPTGRIKGFEAQWIKTFKRLPIFESAVLLMAYTYSDSTATVETRPSEILKVPERSDHLLKAGIQGKLGKLNLGLDFAYQSEALDDVGDASERDEYREDVISLSFKSDYQLSVRTQVSLSVFNLTDHYERSYESTPVRKQRNQSSSWYAVMELKRTF